MVLIVVRHGEVYAEKPRRRNSDNLPGRTITTELETHLCGTSLRHTGYIIGLGVHIHVGRGRGLTIVAALLKQLVAQANLAVLSEEGAQFPLQVNAFSEILIEESDNCADVLGLHILAQWLEYLAAKFIAQGQLLLLRAGRFRGLQSSRTRSAG